MVPEVLAGLTRERPERVMYPARHAGGFLPCVQ